MVETFPSDRPDQSFRKTVLPRRAASDGFVTDAHSSHAACNHRAVDTIPITDQIAWSLVPRECLADLASNPLGSGIWGDGNPDQAPAGQSKRIGPGRSVTAQTSWADIRRFGRLNKTDEDFGTHKASLFCLARVFSRLQLA